jgi:8-oxo-dGTP pyrophosphatase MutT (NUDIX family)
MTDLRTHPAFAARYAQLARVSLNPRRHTCPDALTHSEAVATRAAALARANACSDAERALLENLGRAHDIGKITGTARPEKSLDVLAACELADPTLLALVRWHDTNLPWWNSHRRGQAPTDKAWRKLAGEVDVRLLALFMVADRVDAPGGWRRNAPLTWFLDEAQRRGLIGALVLDLPGVPSEVSAGCVLVDGDRALLIRVRASGFELPKGGLEWDELPGDAALRELREETGVTGDVTLGAPVGLIAYEYSEGGATWLKHVHVFTAHGSPQRPARLPDGVRELRWVTADEAATLPLVHESLRPLIQRALVTP